MKHRTIRLSYLFELSMNLNFMQVLWVSYLFYKGLSLWEIGLVEGIFHIVSLSMEVPTGLIADRYGRKLSRILGACLRLSYMILMLFVSNLPLAIIAFILAALSYNLESGSDTALIYDTLVEHQETQHFPKIQAIREIILQVSSLLGVFVGGYLADISYVYAIGSTIALFIIGIGIACFFVEPKVIETKHSIKTLSIMGFRTLMQYPGLVALMIVGALFSSSLYTTHTYLIVYLQSFNRSLLEASGWSMIEHLGAIMAGFTIYRFTKFMKLNYTLWMMGIMAFLFWWITKLEIGYIALFGLGFGESMLYVSITNMVNQKTPSEVRATVLSMNSMFFSVMMIIMYPMFGWIASTYSLISAFYGLSALLSVGFIIFLVSMKVFKLKSLNSL